MRIDGYITQHNFYKCYCHIDHVKAQDHCTPDETVTYSNMVACYPGPNPEHETPYGGDKKGNWPDYTKGDQTLFVSPLDQSCETRFLFNLKGEIKYKEGDKAAETTINKLGLDHKELKDFRKAAIQGTLGKQNNLPIQNARNRLKKLKSQHEGRLEPFCFVLIQALDKHIKRLEYIAKSKALKNKNKTQHQKRRK
ncbi:hypothetical protein [Tolypothrix sp. VBCCA 56010]|uniref:hypothetical protein n=1 Tax=Tolypothrix sp. VBCCA 56010 TaxID=3137731 RepID=UPI003D7EDF4E